MLNKSSRGNPNSSTRVGEWFSSVIVSLFLVGEEDIIWFELGVATITWPKRLSVKISLLVLFMNGCVSGVFFLNLLPIRQKSIVRFLCIQGTWYKNLITTAFESYTNGQRNEPMGTSNDRGEMWIVMSIRRFWLEISQFRRWVRWNEILTDTCVFFFFFRFLSIWRTCKQWRNYYQMKMRF